MPVTNRLSVIIPLLTVAPIFFAACEGASASDSAAKAHGAVKKAHVDKKVPGKRLENEELKPLIVGADIKFGPITQSFYADGRVMISGGERVMMGTYKIRGDEVCTNTDGVESETCRLIYMDELGAYYYKSVGGNYKQFVSINISKAR